MQEIKPIYEFLLWPNCRNHCKFCFLKKEVESNKEEKEIAIQKAIDFLNSDRYINGSHVLILGGEVFDSSDIFDSLKKLFNLIFEKIDRNEIELLYINTNLIYKKLDLIEYIIQYFSNRNILDRLRFTTSYDLEGRFTPQTEKLMLSNLDYLSNTYSKFVPYVNIILSKAVCNTILENRFSIADFMDKHKCRVNLIPYIIYNEALATDRNHIFKTLLKVDEQIPGYLKSYILNQDLKQKRNLYQYNRLTKELEYRSCGNLSCGHSENYKRYSKAGTCYICDIKELFLND